MPENLQQEQRSKPGPRAHAVRVQAWTDRERCGIPWKAYDAYCQQAANARRRGIVWEFDLSSWWAEWGKGRGWQWEHRGWTKSPRCKPAPRLCCVMARFRDQGPYAPGNVYIATPFDNAHDRPPKERQEAARRALLTRRAREARMADCPHRDRCSFSAWKKRCECRRASTD